MMKRINRINNTIFKVIKDTTEFGISVAIARYKLNHVKIDYLSEKQNYDRCILKWIKKNYKSWNSPLNLETVALKKEYVDKKNVFILWIQGIESAPEMVQACYKTMKRYITGDEVLHVIDMNNLLEYIDMPNYILEKYNSGIITHQSFSDLVRLHLLYVYGGVWLDAYSFMVAPIPQQWFEYPFYSVKKEGLFNMFVSNGKWGIYAISAKSRSNFIHSVLSKYYKYYNKYDILIDYLLIDYFIQFEYENVEYVREMIEKIPTNSSTHYQLVQNLNNKYDVIQLEEWNRSTFFFKLSGKSNYKIDVSTKDSFYYRFINAQ